MLWPARKARQDQKWWIGIMSHLFGRIRRYYALRTSHDVVVAYFCLQLQICVELLDERLPIFPGTKSRLTITGQRTFPAATRPNLWSSGRIVANPEVTTRDIEGTDGTTTAPQHSLGF